MIKSDFQNPSGSQGSTARIRNQNSSRLWQKLANTMVVCSEKWEKIIQWSPLWIIFKGKIKIAHLLPERSTRQGDHFLQT